MIFAGSLDRRISIQQRVIVRDAMGAPKESFSVQYGNVPANVKPFLGKEKFHVESARELSYKQYKFTIRYKAGITEKHRIVYEGQNFDILFIAEEGRREALVITAQVAK